MVKIEQQRENIQIYKRWKGELNIYLALMIAVIIPLVLTMIEAGRVNAMKLQLECITDMGMDSILAEYNRPLLEQYDLLFIDLSYGKAAGSLDYLKDHFTEYIDYNLHPDKDLLVMDYRDLLGLRLDSVDILLASRATDENGAVFRYMAVSYMLNQYGFTYIADIQDMISTSEYESIFSSDIMAENDAAQSAIDGIEIPPPEDLEEGEEWQEPEIENPTEQVNSFRSQGILSIVCTEEISAASINPESYVTGRSLVVGSGMDESFKDYGQIAEELLFNEYVMEKCGNYIQPKDGSLLQYETEYVIAGKNNDTDNLRTVAERILLIRGGANSIYFFANEELMAEAKAMASSLSLILSFPQFEILFEAAIIAGWIYAESVVDVKQLFSGKEVPLIKGAGEWNLSLENALGITMDAVEGAAENAAGTENTKEQGGLGYEDYLRLLLYITSLDEKTGRCMDIVEMDIRQEEGYEHFCLDQCVAAVTFQMVFSSGSGYSFLMQRSCHYT